MKKVLLGLVALSAVSFAAQGDMFLNARVGMDLGAKYDDVSVEGYDILNDQTDGFGGEIALEGYKSLTDNFDLGLGLGYQKHADRDNQFVNICQGGGIEVNGVEYASIPLYLTARYNVDTDSEFKPYLKANLGYSFNFDPSDIEASYGGKLETKVEDGLYWALGGGVEYNNFTVDLMYAVTTAESELEEEDYKEDNNYGRIVLSAGYRFDL
jgi:opacity protein-like surface antigen